MMRLRAQVAPRPRQLRRRRRRRRRGGGGVAGGRGRRHVAGQPTFWRGRDVAADAAVTRRRSAARSFLRRRHVAAQRVASTSPEMRQLLLVASGGSYHMTGIDTRITGGNLSMRRIIPTAVQRGSSSASRVF